MSFYIFGLVPYGSRCTSTSVFASVSRTKCVIKKNLLTLSRSNKYSSKIEDTRHIHTTYILLQIKYNNLYCTKKEVHSHTQL